MTTTKTTTMADWASEYIAHGWRLAALRPGQKGPYQHGWQHLELDAGHWRSCPSDGMGVILGPSGVASIDVDDMNSAKTALWALGIDLEALLNASDSVRIVSREGRAKLLYRVDEDQREVVCRKRALNWRTPNKSSFCVVEFRAGEGLQDVLPPSIHPTTARRYEWRGDWRRMPRLPDALLEVWRQWDVSLAVMRDADPCKGKAQVIPQRERVFELDAGAEHGDVIGKFNDRYDIREVMARPSLAALYDVVGNRWRRRGSTEKAGVVLLECRRVPGRMRVYSHHAGDDLIGGTSTDAFGLYCLAEHGGDVRAAVRAAAWELGLPPLEVVEGLRDVAAVGEEHVQALVASGRGSAVAVVEESAGEAREERGSAEVIRWPGVPEMPEEPDPDPETLAEMPGCLEGRVMPVPEAQGLADWIAGRVGKAKVAATVQTTLAIICHLAGRRYVSDGTGTVPGVLFAVLDSATVNLAPYLRCVDDVLDRMGSYDTGSPQNQLRFVTEKSSNDISTSQGLVEHFRGAPRLLWGSTSIATMLERESRQINPTFRTMLDRLGEIRHGASLHYSPSRGDAYSVKAPAVTALWALTPHSIGGLVRTSSRSGLFQQTLVADALAESAIWRTGRQDLPEAVAEALREVTTRKPQKGQDLPADDFQSYKPLRVPVDDDARHALEELSREIKGSCETGDKMRDHPLGGASRGWTEAAESIALGLAALRDPRAPTIDLGLAEWACAWVLDCWHLHRQRAKLASEDQRDFSNKILEKLREVAKTGATASNLKDWVPGFRELAPQRRNEILGDLEEQGTLVGRRVKSGKRYWLTKFSQ